MTRPDTQPSAPATARGVVVVAFADLVRSAGALELARRLAVPRHRRLLVVHVTPAGVLGGPGSGAYAQLVAQEGERALQHAVDRLGDADVSVRVVQHDVVELALQDAAEDAEADLLVIGARSHRTLVRVGLADATHGLVHGAPCPVAVAPRDPSAADGPRRVVVAFDEGAEAERALAYAVGLAEELGVRVAVRSWADRRTLSEFWAQEQLERARRLVPTSLLESAEVVEGFDLAALAEQLTDGELLVCGSRGRGALGRVVLGSGASRLLAHTTRPAIVVPRPAGR